MTEMSVKVLKTLLLPLKLYMVFSVLSLIGDLIDFIAQIVRFGRPGDEYSDILLVFACLIFVGIDVYYILFIYHFRMHTPDHIKSPLTEAYYGSTEALGKTMIRSVESTKTNLKKVAGMHKEKSNLEPKRVPGEMTAAEKISGIVRNH
jgi:hypothetical protein